MTPEITTALTSTLLHFLWQGAAVAFLLSLLLIVFRDASAQLRYACCCVALALCAILPTATFFITLQAEPRASVALALELLATPATAPSSAPSSAMTSAISPAISSGLSSGAPFAASSGTSWNDWVLLLWAVGVMACSVRLILGQYGAWKLRQGEPITGELARRAREIAQEMGWTRGIAIIKSTLVEVPSVTGWLKPVLLIPPAALMGLTTAQLEAVVAHELAHVRRHDYVVNVLQTILETLLFYHPAVWWISRQIRQEREYCCDDAAVAITGDAVLYARALASLEHLRQAEQGLTKAFLGASTGGNLMKRIQRLHHRMARGNAAWQTTAKWATAPVAGLCGLACAASVTIWMAMLTPGLALGQSETQELTIADVADVSSVDPAAESEPQLVAQTREPRPVKDGPDSETQRNTIRNIQREVDRQMRREIRDKFEREVNRTVRQNVERQLRIAQATAGELVQTAQRAAQEAGANGSQMSEAARAQLERRMEELQKQFAPGGEFEKQMEEIQKRFAPGGEFQKQMEEIGKRFSEDGEFQKQMQELQAQFGEGSDFQKRIQEQFGEGSDFQKQIQAQFGEGSGFQKQMEEQFGEGSDFQKRMKDLGEQFGEGSDFQKQIQEQFGEGSEFQKQMQQLQERFGKDGEFQRNLKQQLEQTLPQQPAAADQEANQALHLKKGPEFQLLLPPIGSGLKRVDVPNFQLLRPLPVELAQNRSHEYQDLERASRVLKLAEQRVTEQREALQRATMGRQEPRDQQDLKQQLSRREQALQQAREEYAGAFERLVAQQGGLLPRQSQEQARDQQQRAEQEAQVARQRAEQESQQARDPQQQAGQEAQRAQQRAEQELERQLVRQEEEMQRAREEFARVTRDRISRQFREMRSADQAREDQRLARQKAEQALQQAEQERQQARDEQQLVRQEAEQALQQAAQEREQALEQARQQQLQIQELKREIERLQQERTQQSNSQSTAPQANQP